MKYEIQGDTLPVVICEIEEDERIICEGGAMSWMSPNMEMETSSNGGFGKVIGRLFTGENLFQNIYTAKGNVGTIAFASKFPGSIKAFEISAGNEIVFQKGSWLAAEDGVDFQVFFNKKVGVGIFGGEGFVLQKASGNGIVFAEFDGSVVEYELEEGQSIVVDTGHLAALSSSCSIDIQSIKGMKNVLLGGEGLFNTIVTGPGKIYLQTMPLQNLAEEIKKYIPTQAPNNNNKSNH